MTTEDDSMEGGIRFPEMNDAMLSRDEVDALFEDIGSLCRVHGILLKQSGREFVAADDRPRTLDGAREALSEGRIRGVQIRYVYDGSEWWDTLMVMPGGIRLVRARHDSGREKVDE